MSGSDVILKDENQRPDDSLLLSVEEALRGALALERESVGRLCYAKTSVSFGLGSDPGDWVTLLLAGDHPTVVRGGAAETHINFQRHQAERYCRGELHL